MKRAFMILALFVLWVLPVLADNAERISEINADILDIQVGVERAVVQKARIEQGIAQAQTRLVELNAIKGELVRQDREAEKNAIEKDKVKSVEEPKE